MRRRRRGVRSLSRLIAAVSVGVGGQTAGTVVAAPRAAESRGGQSSGVDEVRRLLAAGRFGAALAAADRTLAGPGAAPELHHLRAEALTGLLDYPGAVEALAHASEDAGSLALRTRLLALLGRDSEAAAAAESLAALETGLPTAERVALSQALRGAGLIATARETLGPVGAEEPRELALERARLRIAEDDCAGALGLLESAAASPALPGAAYELGRCLALVGRREEAVDRLRSALAHFPGDRAARFRLGQLLVREEDAGRRAEGRRLLDGYEEDRLRERRRQLILSQVTGGELEGADLRDALTQLLGLLLDAAEAGGGATPESSAETERLLAAAAARFPDDPAFRIARARQLLLSAPDGPRRAAAHLEPLVPAAPAALSGPGLSAARWLAEARLREGDPATAAALFDRVLAAASDAERLSPRVLRAAATAFALSGDPARGLALFDRALAATGSSPARAALLADSALALSMLGREQEAESRYREALSVEPRQVSAAVGLAELLLASGRAAEAAAILRQALAHAPENETLRALLSRAEPPR